MRLSDSLLISHLPDPVKNIFHKTEDCWMTEKMASKVSLLPVQEAREDF
jgi:hypothetical protein